MGPIRRDGVNLEYKPIQFLKKYVIFRDISFFFFFGSGYF